MEEEISRMRIVKLLDKYFEGVFEEIGDWEDGVEDLVDGLVELVNYYNNNDDNFTVKRI